MRSPDLPAQAEHRQEMNQKATLTTEMKPVDETRLPALRRYPPGFTRPRAARGRLARDLRAHYEAGATIRDLAEKTGRSPSSVHTYLRQSGTTMRPSPSKRTR